MSSLLAFLNSLPEEIKWHGGNSGRNRQIILRAGHLRMLYENCNLRYISLGNREIIRMIYPAVRDRNWITIDPEVIDENVEINEDSFRLTCECLYRSNDIYFSAKYVFEGGKTGNINCTIKGEALESFEKNRIGLCVLHPIGEYAGTNCTIEHTNGSMEQSLFPEEISPGQVFTDIKSMTWLANNTRFRIDFEGEVFETEDQRNWTDASFKTYSTPLSKPFPVTIEKGSIINQSVKLNIEGASDHDYVQDEKIIVRLLPDESSRIPSIGICRSAQGSGPGKNSIRVLRSVHFDHYRIDLHLYDDNWKVTAEKAYGESQDLGTSIEMVLFFDDNVQVQIKSFLGWLSARKISISSIILLHRSYPSTPDHLASAVIPLLHEADPDIKIITGTNANFAQLNRNRPGETGNDSLCYSIHPQQHASDNTTLVENLEAQKYTVKTAQIFAGNKGIAISPVTLQRRFNESNTLMEVPWSLPAIPPQIDSRMMSLFAGCWTTGSLKYLIEAGAESITYFETTGERGIIQGEKSSQWPDYFQSIKGMIFPVYHVFRFLLGNRSLRAIKSISSKPLITDCLALTDGKQARIILVNYTGSVQTMRFECCSGLFRIRPLNAESYINAALDHRWTGIDHEMIIKSQNDFNLEPFSINFIEGWLRH